MNPSTNLGKRYQISMALTFSPARASTLEVQYTATQKAITPISTFWISLTVAATYRARSPRKAPAAATAPVASMVPPIQAAPSTVGISRARITLGITTIMIAVKTRERPTARVSSSFLARHAAAVAMAADTPQTDMSAEMVMFSVLDCRPTTF